MSARGSVVKQLEAVTVIAERPTVTGYDRERFGRWATDGACDTRKQVLASWFRASSCSLHDAHVIPDPYGGGEVSVDEVDVDHIFPLAAAWDLGAAGWDAGRRKEFANDVEANLIPTRSSINREKSDATPGEWMPKAEMQCDYAQRYLTVALKWQLSVTVADWHALARACDLA